MKTTTEFSEQGEHFNFWIRVKLYTLFSIIICLVLVRVLFIEFQREEFQFLCIYGLTVLALYLYFLGRKNKALLEDLESKIPW